MPHILYPDIPCDFVIVYFPCEKSFPDVSTSDHLQDTSDVSLSLQCEEDTYSSQNPSKLSSIFPENIEVEHLCFPSTPLPDSSNHEDVDEHPESYDLGCHDLSTSSSNQNVDSTIVNLYKTLVYNDLSINKVKTPQTIEAL